LSSARCSALLGWYRENARDLPWRHTADPYPIWISEIMLQQTQVKTVLPRYRAWFDLFPDISTLAAANLDDVLKAWEGLGYYRRARFIHAAARMMIEDFAGRFPTDFDDIVKLPGIGASTAGAIASFCYGASTPVLDGNVKRVLRRWYASPDCSDKQLWAHARQAIEGSGSPADWNQAMMELGATVCAPTNPGCRECPVQRYCASAFQADAAVKKVVPVRDVHWQLSLHLDADKGIWLTQRPEAGIWAGLWTPPITELAVSPDVAPCHVHLLTHRRLHLYAQTAKSAPSGNGQWVSDISQYALPTGIHRLLAKHGIGA